MEKDDSLKQRWGILEGRKGSLHERNEKYARWTLPYIYAPLDVKDEELDTDLDSIGARAVNHLSNKLTETLFPSYRPFLKLELTEELKEKFAKAEVPQTEIDKALVSGEKSTIRELDKLGHRTGATMASKLLIITGNALVYYPKVGKVQVYSTRDYCVVRDLSGTVIEFITRDTKAFETFTEEVQSKLKASDEQRKYEDGTDVELYTQVKLSSDSGKYEVSQAADMVDLDVDTNQYAKKDLPWVPLSWNLTRGDDYGRGMVEDYRGAFAAVDVLSQALLEGVITAATVKFLVNPGSVVDIAELNKSANGTFHAGRDGDITTIKSDKHLDFQQVRQVLEDYTRQIAQAFLLNSAVTRDAERVTAEEIRYQAQELEMAYGGVYSRFTEDWQEPVAHLLLSRKDIKISDDTIFPVIVTGLDTLSRMGDLDNFRMFTQDLSLIASMPESVQARLKVGNLMTWVGNNRGLDYATFIKTEDEIQQEQQQALQQQQQLQQQETANQMAQDAGREIAKDV